MREGPKTRPFSNPMKTQTYRWFPLVAALTFTVACSNGPDSVGSDESTDSESAVESSAPAPDMVEAPVANKQPEKEMAHKPVPAASSAQGGLIGPVTETMDAGGYTYVLIETVDGAKWAAGPPTPVEIGQVVRIVESFPMKDFTSDTLDRTFETIYFCSSIEAADVSGDSAQSHMSADASASSGDIVAKAAGGQTIAEAITGKDKFIGKEILIRARVAKFSADIMGKNWMHLRDGSGSEGTNDLTVTTSASAAVGDVVLMKGILTADKDFGYGYKYDLIVEDAEVSAD